MTVVVQPAGNPAPEQHIPPMPTVLVVDDETLIRWSVSESLETAGFEVAEATSAREALGFFESPETPIKVVILDLKLPDSNDLGLLHKIRTLAPACRIILMTAHGTREVLDEALRAGAHDVLGKPFDMARIVHLVRNALPA